MPLSQKVDHLVVGWLWIFKTISVQNPEWLGVGESDVEGVMLPRGKPE